MKPQKKKDSARSVVKLAQELLKKDEAALEELRMHNFPDDESAHDDELTEQIYVEFSAEVEAVQAELSKEYGPPLDVGGADTNSIPLNGVFRYANWRVGDKQLFVAAHHEDRGVPIILWLGTVPQ